MNWSHGDIRMPKPGTTPAGYVLPRRPRWQGGWNLKAVFAAALAFVAGSFGATEWLAASFANPVELGQPLFVYRGVGVFSLFGALKLWIRFVGSQQISEKVREDL